MNKVTIPRPKMVAVSKLKMQDKNVKLHPASQIRGLAKLINLVGFKDPIVIDSNFDIWAGHGRLLAAKLLKMVKVPCVDVSHLTEDQKKAFMLLDNKINESDWNTPNMKLILADLPKFDFAEYELDFSDAVPRVHVSDTIESGEPDDPADQVPEKAPTVCQFGDVWKLGSHRLMCGDAKDADFVAKLLGDHLVDQMITDPPYGVSYGDKNEYMNKMFEGKRIETPIESDQEVEDYRLDFKQFIELVPFNEYNTFYIFMSGLHLHDLRLAVEDAHCKYGDYLIWIKNSIVFSRKDYFAKNEFILYGWKGKHKFYGGYTSTLIEFKRPQRNDLHPTMKPVGLIERLMQDGSIEGANIYDPFAGSGTTLIACERRDRKCFAMEIDPHYCDVIIKRWEDFTGSKAEKLS